MSSTLAKVRDAEQLLFDLACQLRGVPVAPGTARIHVRALELKREIQAWQTAPPDEAATDAVLAELRKLTDGAERLHRRVRHRRPLSCTVGSRRPGFPLGRRADENSAPHASGE